MENKFSSSSSLDKKYYLCNNLLEKDKEGKMEYGIIQDPSINWALIITGIACLLAGVILLVVHEMYMSYKRRANDYRGEGEDFISGTCTTFAVLLFVATVVLLISGFLAMRRSEGIYLLPKHASDNEAYRVVEAKLVYHTKDMTDSKGNYVKDNAGNVIKIPKRPNYFAVKLEGRVSKNVPSDVRIVRWFRVPYDRISQNYKFTPPMPETGTRVEVIVPEYIIKYTGDFWKFSDTGPETLPSAGTKN